MTEAKRGNVTNEQLNKAWKAMDNLLSLTLASGVRLPSSPYLMVKDQEGRVYRSFVTIEYPDFSLKVKQSNTGTLKESITITEVADLIIDRNLGENIQVSIICDPKVAEELINGSESPVTFKDHPFITEFQLTRPLGKLKVFSNLEKQK